MSKKKGKHVFIQIVDVNESVHVDKPEKHCLMIVLNYSLSIG